MKHGGCETVMLYVFPFPSISIGQNMDFIILQSVSAVKASLDSRSFTERSPREDHCGVQPED